MSAFKFSGNEEEHFVINGPNFDHSVNLPRGTKYITLNKALKGFILIYGNINIEKVYVNINRAVGDRMNYNLEKFDCVIFTKAGFLKGDYMLFKGASYIINHFSEFDDKINFIKNIKEDKLSTKQLYVDLAKDNKKIYVEFLLENNILTLEDCINLLKEELCIENSLLLNNFLNSFSDEDIKKHNDATVRKEDLDIGIESYKLDDLKKIFDCEIKDDNIIVKKPKIVEEVIIFSCIDGVSNYSFKSMASDKTIKRIFFEEGVKRITALDAKNIFTKLSELKEIYLPNSIEHIDDVILETLQKGVKVYSNNKVCDYAVVKNKLIHFNIEKTEKNILIPEGVEYVRPELFRKRPNSTFITFPSTIKNICENMFRECSIKSIKFNQPLVNELVIGSDAFRYTGCVFEIPNGTTHIGDYAFSANKNKEIVVPEGVISIGDNSFEYSRKTVSIKLPNSLKSIGNYCFLECGLIKSIFIPENVAEIGEQIFERCYKLESIEVDNKNKFFTSIDGVLYNKDCTTLIAFPANYKENEYTILDGVTTISKSAFMFSKLQKINLPSSLILIDETAFYFSNINEIDIPNSVTHIKQCAFANCKSIVNVKLPDCIDELGEAVFSSCENLENIILPNNLEVISKSLLASCKKINSIIIPKSVKKIESNAFWCSSIAYIFIPKNVIELEYASLDVSKDSIVEIEHNSKPDTWDDKFFGFSNVVCKWGVGPKV